MLVVNDVFVFLDLCNADINSRFVSKGPIHKLLNNIAMSLDSAFDILKRNLLYDLNLEPSKTSVEFKEIKSQANNLRPDACRSSSILLSSSSLKAASKLKYKPLLLQQPLHEMLNQANTKLSRISEPLNWRSGAYPLLNHRGFRSIKKDPLTDKVLALQLFPQNKKISLFLWENNAKPCFLASFGCKTKQANVKKDMSYIFVLVIGVLLYQLRISTLYTIFRLTEVWFDLSPQKERKKRGVGEEAKISASGPYFSTSPTLREKWPHPINDIFPANLLSASMQKPLSFRSILLHKPYSQRKMADAIAVFSQQSK
ncbi:hypothetical protein H5410_010763 [Solanum commersonii]|uniref:Uncharacterized protein n=1 Tax=Solanum commersonii TaxID=4109 RepID=A0A9J6AMC9_SOLCO|nr:hypothetical protein H5410_010763 [Solanum commersonii]